MPHKYISVTEIIIWPKGAPFQDSTSSNYYKSWGINLSLNWNHYIPQRDKSGMSTSASTLFVVL